MFLFFMKLLPREMREGFVGFYNAAHYLPRNNLRNWLTDNFACRRMLAKSLRDMSRGWRGTVANRVGSVACRRNTWLPFWRMIVNPALRSAAMIVAARSIGKMLMRIR